MFITSGPQTTSRGGLWNTIPVDQDTPRQEFRGRSSMLKNSQVVMRPLDVRSRSKKERVGNTSNVSSEERTFSWFRASRHDANHDGKVVGSIPTASTRPSKIGLERPIMILIMTGRSKVLRLRPTSAPTQSLPQPFVLPPDTGLFVILSGLELCAKCLNDKTRKCLTG